jgi:predicted transcriptional regulator
MRKTKVNNSPLKNLNDSEIDENTSNEPKRTMVRIINEIKEDIYKHFNELQKDTNQQLNEFKKNSNKHLNEIWKTIQDVKEEVNKNREILRKIKLKFWK